MKRTKSILLGVVFLSALAFASCGPRQAKEAKEGEKKECCEKKDSTACCEKKDSTACAHKDSTACAHKDTTSCEKKCEHKH